jgi:Asp-tRNA(Asn)/Glu-tRNA(Gln) amidotransferase A subunit family amidase
LGTTDGRPLVIQANGSERMLVTTDGNMRIGTNAPSGKLHVNGDAAITGNVLTTGLVGVGTTSLPERSICFSTNHSVFQTVEDGLKPER